MILAGDRVAPERTDILTVFHQLTTSGQRRQEVVMSTIQMAGLRFGYLTVLRLDSESHCEHAKWICRCDCGLEKSVRGNVLRRGATKSCGCKQSDLLRGTIKSHQCSYTTEYKIWTGIIQRCENENDRGWPKYGGRGVSICPRWRISFVNFLHDVGPRPSNDFSIDRIDNDGNYEPGNCRWATRSQQAKNRRKRRYVNGKYLPAL